MTSAIRTLAANDAGAYNAFFRRGAELHLDSLRIAPADIDSAPFETSPSPDGATFACIDDEGVWIGVVAVERERGRVKRRHIAWVVRMYVKTEASGRGVGRALLRRALDFAAAMPDVSKVNLTVAADNVGAIRLYTEAGFVSFAREEDAFRSPASCSELTMSAQVAR